MKDEKQIILDFLEWTIQETDWPCGKYFPDIEDVNGYIASKQPQEEEHQDWFLHTHWTENRA